MSATQAASRQGARVLLWALLLSLAGCSSLRPWTTPTDVTRWQDATPPVQSLAEKADHYQERIESVFQLPDGLVRYRRRADEPRNAHGNHADGSHFQGIYLASQVLRWVTTGEPAARAQVVHALRGMRLFAEVSGHRGLLARYFATTPTVEDPRWQPSPTRPGYFWRGDVSKDQYAGFVHGLGVSLALLRDPELRREAAELAAALADHLIAHDLRIVDADGEVTRHGDLRGRIWRLPIGVNALIALAIAKTAAVGTGDERYHAFYEELVADGYLDISYWAHVALPGQTKRVNDHMAYLSLYPLLLLEKDAERRAALRRGARRTWSHVADERNGFFASIHAGVVATEDAEVRDAGARTRAALAEFPERKIGLPVDLTRPGYDFPQACLRGGGGRPRGREPVPLYLRPSSSSLWVEDPYLLAGRLRHRGDTEFAGIDYLVAYWLGRYHGSVGARE